MKLTFRTPSKRRAKAFGTTFQSIGSFLGGLPVTVRPGGKDRSGLLRLAIPVGVIAALTVGLLLRRRARSSVETWDGDSTSPFEPDPAPAPDPALTETAQRKAEVTGGDESPAQTPRAAAAETPAAAEVSTGETP